MTPVHIAGLLALLCIVLYAVLGGADFGGGVWDLLASGPRRDKQREAIGLAMSPVWETNHMWLIFALVTLFTCFPPVFAKLSVALYIPLTFALGGIIMRGAAFAFRGPSTSDLWVHRAWGQIFGVASVVTPFLFGAAAASVATGTFDWLQPFSLCVGVFAVTLGAQTAAVFLCAETRGHLQDDFKKRAIAATFAVAFAGLLALVVAYFRNPALFAGLVSAIPAVAIAMLCGLVTLWLLWTERFIIARILTGLQTTAVLCGWFIAEGPYVNRDLGLQVLSAPNVTITTYLWIALAGSIVLAPSLWLLFSVFKRDALDA